MNRSGNLDSPRERLLIVPTAMERDKLRIALEHVAADDSSSPCGEAIKLCGFGIAAAAAMTMRHLHQHPADHVILAGIAGSLSTECALGSAYWFSEVYCDGIGVGEADSFETAAQMNWKQIESESIGDRIDLNRPPCRTHDRASGLGLGLVTACAASSDVAMASRRVRRVRDTQAGIDGGSSNVIAAEDMEGFGVALACRIMNVKLSIIRGISNQAGDREHSQWRIDDAIDAVAEQLVFSMNHFPG